MNTTLARADELAVNDMEFLLFLASSVVSEGELVTPLDLEHLAIEEHDPASAESDSESKPEASDE